MIGNFLLQLCQKYKLYTTIQFLEVSNGCELQKQTGSVLINPIENMMYPYSRRISTLEQCVDWCKVTKNCVGISYLPTDSREVNIMECKRFTGIGEFRAKALHYDTYACAAYIPGNPDQVL